MLITENRTDLVLGVRYLHVYTEVFTMEKNLTMPDAMVEELSAEERIA